LQSLVAYTGKAHDTLQRDGRSNCEWMGLPNDSLSRHHEYPE
jgi:hypothetical protein